MIILCVCVCVGGWVCVCVPRCKYMRTRCGGVIGGRNNMTHTLHGSHTDTKQLHTHEQREVSTKRVHRAWSANNARQHRAVPLAQCPHAGHTYTDIHMLQWVTHQRPRRIHTGHTYTDIHIKQGCTHKRPMHTVRRYTHIHMSQWSRTLGRDGLSLDVAAFRQDHSS